MPSVKGATVTLTKPFEPIFINMDAPAPWDDGQHELTIAKPAGGQYPVPGEIKCKLEMGQKYHIFLVGEFVFNKTLDVSYLTDYDVEVYDPYMRLVSRHTESAGQPEQVASGVKKQYFVPEMEGSYTFRIYNDPKDSRGDEAAVFMLIKHIEMNKEYSVTLYGKSRVGDPYPVGFNYAYEFDTPNEDFELVVKVPDPNLNQGYPGLDMYEARVYPMANPSQGVGHYLRGIGVPWGHMLSGQHNDMYGGYNTSIEGASFIDYTASCEFSGEDMIVTFGKPVNNSTETVVDDPTVFYYLVLLAEYDYGTVEFYLKTDYRPLNVTLVYPDVVGYTGRETTILANVASHNEIERVWVNYTIDNWATQDSIEMAETPDGYKCRLPRLMRNDLVKYRVHARDEVDNTGSTTGVFEVKDMVDLSLSMSRISMYGGESINIVGSSTLSNTEHTLRFQCGSREKTVKVMTGATGEYEYSFTPPWVGSYTVTLEYGGDGFCHASVTTENGFTVQKRTLVVTTSLGNSVAKETQPFQISGRVTPAIGRVPICVLVVSPTESFTQSCVTTGTGSFSITIVPEALGSWEILAQVETSEYYTEA
ncbi:hypothetical protein JXL21_09515, partial [Candidatus Bathyarchaeota archaeon]|nr:hypothetical protein [Candidatus Bathyarchaeota archaeon]